MVLLSGIISIQHKLHSLQRSEFFFLVFSRIFFEWKNPLGYSFVFIGEVILAYYIEYTSTACVCFPLGVCCFLMAFANDVKAELSALNEYNQLRENKFEMYKKFANAIEFHSIVKQLS